MATAKKKEPSFEQAKEELDGIVEKLGAGSLPLDDMVKLYEKGMALSAYCKKMLDAYEGRLMQVDAEMEEQEDGENEQLS